jgi:hypothetical protein
MPFTVRGAVIVISVFCIFFFSANVTLRRLPTEVHRYYHLAPTQNRLRSKQVKDLWVLEKLIIII